MIRKLTELQMLLHTLLLLPFCWAKCPTDTVCDKQFNKCHKYVEEGQPFFTAEENCMSLGGHLAPIHNAFENAIIGETADSMFNGYNDYWIGANYIISNKWSWTDGTSLDFVNWFPDEPSAQTAASMILKSKLWTTADPDLNKPYICELLLTETTVTRPSGRYTCPSCPTVACPAPTVCPTLPAPTPAVCPTTQHIPRCETGWTLLDRTNSCYKVAFGAAYMSAEDVCVTSGAHLVSLHSQEENDFVADLASTGHPVYYLDATTIGFYRANGNWRWTDDSPVDFFAWGLTAPENHPTSHCTRLFPRGYSEDSGWYNKWEAYDCDVKLRNFVCKKPAL